MPTRQEIRDTLFGIVSGKILFDEPMYRHTSMGVGGRADILVSPGTIEELEAVVSFCRKGGVPFSPVGNCTNLIVRDGGYRGAIVSLKNLEQIRLERGEDRVVCLSAEAGVSLAKLVDVSVRKSLTGLEFCAGIPGTVGGGMKMNAGAYGKELKDVVRSVSLINMNGTVKEVARSDLRFEYRNLILAEGSVIVRAAFALAEGSQDEIREKVTKLMGMRKKKHPLGYRSAGSIFKNPSTAPAGKIIDEMGFKGFRIGDAKISELHGNFIVNLDNAKARDVIDLVELVQKRVLEDRGIRLEPEIKIIGED